MKWWFLEKAAIETTLSDKQVIERIQTIVRPRHRVLDTLNPDHTFDDEYKRHVGTIEECRFRVKRNYYTISTRGRGRSIGLGGNRSR